MYIQHEFATILRTHHAQAQPITRFNARFVGSRAKCIIAVACGLSWSLQRYGRTRRRRAPRTSWAALRANRSNSSSSSRTWCERWRTAVVDASRTCRRRRPTVATSRTRWATRPSARTTSSTVSGWASGSTGNTSSGWANGRRPSSTASDWANGPPSSSTSSGWASGRRRRSTASAWAGARRRNTVSVSEKEWAYDTILSHGDEWAPGVAMFKRSSSVASRDGGEEDSRRVKRVKSSHSSVDCR